LRELFVPDDDVAEGEEVQGALDVANGGFSLRQYLGEDVPVRSHIEITR
jgi:hypothetical protein